MKRCTKCIMPETLPGITFDKDGVCYFCQNYMPEKYLGKEKLDQIIAYARDKNNKYDCIVPLSGGRDSTYVLYVAKAIYDLKVLAVNYNNEFQNPQALINMKNSCEKLDTDFVTIRSEKNIARKMVKCNIKFSHLKRKGGICRACSYGMKSVVYRTALQYKVPMIFWGDSQQERTNPMEKIASKFIKVKKGTVSKLLNPDFYKYEYFFLRQRQEFHVPGNSYWRREPKLKNDNIKEIHIYDYIPWNRREIKETIMDKLGWKVPPDSISTWRNDCLLTPLLNYIFYTLFDCGKETFGYCKMINSGQMSREEAMKQEIETRAHMVDKNNIRKFLESEVGLTKVEVDRLL